MQIQLKQIQINQFKYRLNLCFISRSSNIILFSEKTTGASSLQIGQQRKIAGKYRICHM